MPSFSAAGLRRRRFLQAGAACTVAGFAGRASAAPGSVAGPAGFATRLLPGSTHVRMVGDEVPETAVWSYNGVEPGPVLRVRQGAPFHAVVENQLPEATTVHWHGIRLPNAMDGVPGLTQQTILPGARFDYAFTPADAGTFWYHSHENSLDAVMGPSVRR